MVRRLFLVYALVELAAIFTLALTIGWGWTLLVLAGSFLLGWGLLAPMAGGHLIRQIGIRQAGRLRSRLTDARGAVNDGAVVTLALVLVLIPGPVTTALGLLLLVPPIRSIAGPGVAAMGARRLRRVPVVTYSSALRDFRRRYPDDEGRGYIDGEVIDVKDFETPAYPTQRRGGFPGDPAWD
ncbi:FxsA family protein [Mycobacterium sp.]|uniref:FxsA family protein n=1 Tax=Mycobacterium sp. TaxID=1785 RepID=UPI0025DA9CC6|nr:FxsA family protein [Mycobacterium sp.]MBW0012955.1 FxsA family protein [Mycobacterium sp.]